MLDSDCDYGLARRLRTEYQLKPCGCDGINNPSQNMTYSFYPDTNQLVSMITMQKSNNADPKLGVCKGSCSNDDDCKGHLECFKRRSNEMIPGCVDKGTVQERY
jgi:hypothetical protein